VGLVHGGRARFGFTGRNKTRTEHRNKNSNPRRKPAVHSGPRREKDEAKELETRRESGRRFGDLGTRKWIGKKKNAKEVGGLLLPTGGLELWSGGALTRSECRAVSEENDDTKGEKAALMQRVAEVQHSGPWKRLESKWRKKSGQTGKGGDGGCGKKWNFLWWCRIERRKKGKPCRRSFSVRSGR